MRQKMPDVLLSINYHGGLITKFAIVELRASVLPDCADDDVGLCVVLLVVVVLVVVLICTCVVVGGTV